MGSFVLDFSAYNALLHGNGQSTSYYGPDDAYLGGGDPGLSAPPGRRSTHHNHPNQHHNHHSNHQQHNSHHQAGQNNTNNNTNHNHTHTHHEISNRYLTYDRNSLPRLDAEKTFLDRRKTQIANFGATWLKPPGVPKTLYQIREECREQEEQAEAERREELAQQLVQAEAAALDGEGGEGATAGDMTGDPGGATDLMDDAAAAAAAAGMDTDMIEGRDDGEEENEPDLDNEIPDGDGADFSFGNNDDGDDPFASSTEEEDDDDDEEDEDEDGNGDRSRNDAIGGDELEDDRATATLGGDGSSGYYTTHGGSEHQHQQGTYEPFRGHASSSFHLAAATPVRTVEEQREQARARAAERREMRQMRATEDRMRAMRAHPRLSGMGMGLYGEEDDLDEEDQAQMLQEDDLVREVGQQQQQQQHNQHQNQQQHTSGSGGLRSDDDLMDSHYYQFHDDDGNMGRDGDDGGLEMDMDADLDGDVPEGSSALNGAGAMDLSIFDGGYEHTDTEAELSSSVIGAGEHHTRGGTGTGSGSGVGTADNDLDLDIDLNLPHHGFLSPSHPISMGTASAAPRSSGGGRRFRSSLAQSEHNNSLDISSLLSRDGSSNFGSSPQVRRL